MEPAEPADKPEIDFVNPLDKSPNFDPRMCPIELSRYVAGLKINKSKSLT